MVRIESYALYVKSLIREYVKAKGFDVSPDLLNGTVLNNVILTILDKAVEYAKVDDRDYIIEQDILDHLSVLRFKFSRNPEKRGIVKIPGKIISFTDQALLLVFDDGKEIWIPKSTIENNYDINYKERQKFEIDMWIGGTEEMRRKFVELLKKADKLPRGFMIFSILVQAIKKTEVIVLQYPLIKKKFKSLLKKLKKIPPSRSRLNSKPISHLINAIKETEIIDNNFEDLLKNYCPNPATFFELINAVKETNLMTEHFTKILNKLEEFPVKDRLFTFLGLIERIKGTEAFEKNFSLIESKLLYEFVNTSNDLDKYNVFCGYFEALKGTDAINSRYEFIESNFNELLNSIDKVHYEYRIKVFVKLFNTIKGTNLMLDHRIRATYNALRELQEENPKLFNYYGEFSAELFEELADNYFNNDSVFKYIK